MNENYSHPAMPEGVEQDIINGCYLFKTVGEGQLEVNLMGSGTIFREVIAAADLLAQDFGIKANVFSATSFNKLHRDGMAVTRHNMLNPLADAAKPFVTRQLEKTNALVTVASTDYIRSFADRIREYVPGRYVTLGTDGFGRSDFRKALREFFEVNRYYVAVAALKGLADEGLIEARVVADALVKYGINTNKANPWEV
jgi:pyruvate dehydrogenase E1 component